MAAQDDFSRYLFCLGLTDAKGNFYLTDRVPFRYIARSDNRFHTAAEGDTLFTLAHKYFAPLPRAEKLYWVIADFQPTPILDATVKLTIGATIVIPSVRCVKEEIFNESRRVDFAG